MPPTSEVLAKVSPAPSYLGSRGLVARVSDRGRVAEV